MSDQPEPQPTRRRDVIRPTDDQAVRLAKTLIRTARFGAIAVLDPEGGAPLASRVGVATDLDGTPLILVSMLSAHTRALLADPRASLLLGEPGKGDPLAHPRISLSCQARRLEPDTAERARARRRYLSRNPKAALYVELGDFSFFRMEIVRASLNGGFGRAFELSAADLETAGDPELTLDAAEQDAIDHMNADHADAITLYATRLGGATGTGWRLTGIDAEGIDLVAGDRTARIVFDAPLADAGALRPALVAMAKAARGGAEAG